MRNTPSLCFGGNQLTSTGPVSWRTLESLRTIKNKQRTTRDVETTALGIDTKGEPN